MVMAQGDKTNGYGLFVLNNKMHFQVNQNGKSYKMVTPQALPASFAFKAGLEKNGTMHLFIDDKQAGTVKAAGLFSNEVRVPVRVGTETQSGNSKIGTYPDSAFILRSNLKVKLETLGGIVAPAKETVKIDKVITINVLKNVMKYDKELITAKAGTTIKIILKNPDFMQHNLVIIKKGTLEKVGAAADRLAQTGDGAKINYVPKVPEVLEATPLIDPNGKYTMTFKVPDIPGNYPYVCTFPGHWRIMKGILKVTK
jgi:azurin